VIAGDFAFRGNNAGNTVQSFRDHEPGRDAAGDNPDKTGSSHPFRGVASFG
jgi:hypothetical protein